MRWRAKSIWVSFIAVILALGIEAGQHQAAAQEGQATAATGSDVPKIVFEKYTLPNGLQVILHVDHKLPMVHVNNWYHVGLEERTHRTQRLRAPFRAHDVRRLEGRQHQVLELY